MMPGRAGRAEPGGEALLSYDARAHETRARRAPAAGLPAAPGGAAARRSCGPLGAVLAAAIVVALLAQLVGAARRAPRARPARAGVRGARRAALHARRLAVGSHAARADDAPRVRRRPARCRAPRAGRRCRWPASTAPASATASRGRLLGYGTLTLGDGPQGRDVRFVSDAERVAEAILEAGPARSHLGADRGAGCL